MASTISAGTTSTTALVYSADTSGVLQLQTNGTTTAVTIDTSQNVGIAVSTSSGTGWSNGQMEFPSGSNIVSQGNNISFGQNYYYNSAYKYKTSTAAAYFEISQGTYQWYIAPSGTAGNTITFTQAMYLDNNGNLGLGVTPSSWYYPAIQLANGSLWSRPDPAVGLVANAYSSTSGGGWKYIASAAATRYQQTAGTHIFEYATSGTAGNTVSFLTGMTLNNSGNLSITTSAVTSVISARSGASGDVSQEAVQFIKYDNNTTTSQIFAKFFINQGGAASGQINANGANQAAFGSTSDITLKTNITPLASQLANINAIELIEFDYIESEGGGHNIGFSAQNMQTIYPDTVGTRADGKLTLTGWNKTEARLVKAIQELSAQVTTLQSQVAALTPKA